MNMDILNKVEESKRRTTLMNNVAIDWQYAQQLMPQILNDTPDQNEAYKSTATILINLLENVENGVRELKKLIPNFRD